MRLTQGRVTKIWLKRPSKTARNFLVRALVQVCWDLTNPDTCDRELKALLAANKKFKAERLTIISQEKSAEELILEGYVVSIIPAWQWLLSQSVVDN